MENLRGFAYVAVGCAIGAAAMILLAPKSGPETVKYLRKKAEEGTDYIKQQLENARDAVTDASKSLRVEAENVSAAVEARTQAY
jgi:gas vesicle protein